MFLPLTQRRIKIVQPVSNTVLSTYDYVLPANQEIRTMLGRNTSR